MLALPARYRRPVTVGTVCAAVSATLGSVLLAVSTVPPKDLAVYRAAGWSLLHGTGLYGAGFPAELPLTYPPFAAWPFVVLVPLPWAVTVWLWTFATLMLLAWVIIRSFGGVLGQAPARRAAVVALLLVAFGVTTPVVDHVGFGQINVALMALCLADLLGVRPRRLPAGVLIGLAAAVKLTPAIFIVYLLLTRRWRAAVTATITAAVATLAAFAVSPADSRTFYFDLLWHLDARVGLGNNAGIGNQSLQGAVLRLGLPERWVHPTWLVLAVLVGVAGIWASRRAWARRGDLAGAGAAGLVAVLVSPVSWPHYLVWLIPAAGMLLGDGRRTGARCWAGAIWLLLVARVHRLGQDLADLRPAMPLQVVAQLGRDGYVLLCLAVLSGLAMSPPRSGIQTGVRRPPGKPDEALRSKRPGVSNTVGEPGT
jgi:alpha-1,2-mannosyltransferase